MLPPIVRAPVDDRVWRAAARLLVAAALLVGASAAPGLALGLAAGALAASFGAAALLVPAFGGGLRRDAARPGVPWQGVVGADLVVCVAAAALLARLDLAPVAVLAPLGVVAAHAHERGVAVARVTAGVVLASVAVLVVVLDVDEPLRDGIVLLFAAALAVLSVLAGSAMRDAEAVTVEDRASIDTFRQAIITTVSHELRTPLTIVQGITWALVSRWDQLAETQKLDLIDTLGVNIASLDASILHFLDAGRLARGEWEIRPGWVDTAPMVERVVAKLSPVLAGYDVQQRLEVDRVWADEEALGRAIELLLVNACRFSPPASAIGVRITGGGDAGWDVAVVDRGQGIPPKDLAHVFEPLWRADVQDSGVSRGAGLGLAIVKELAERHGGKVAVTSSRGRGSTFRITLPPPPVAGAR